MDKGDVLRGALQGHTEGSRHGLLREELLQDPVHTSVIVEQCDSGAGLHQYRCTTVHPVTFLHEVL